MSFRDGALASTVGSVFAVGIDILLNGGEVILILISILAEQSGLVYLLLARLVSAAPNVAWLPTTQIEIAFTVVSLLLAGVALIQLLRNVSRRLQAET